jgi:hypothetical protein
METDQELSPSELLNKAAALIETYGWCQGDYGSKDDGFCALGALGRAAGHRLPALAYHSPNYRGSLLAAHNALDRKLGGNPVFIWNDASNTTKEKVISTLKCVAKELQPNQPQSSITNQGDTQ